MHRIAGAGVGAIEKHVDASCVAVHEPRSLHCRLRCRPVGSPQQNADIARRPHRGFIGLSDPGPHGIPANDGIGHARLLQRPGRPLQTLLDLFHSSVHSAPQRFAGEMKGN